jgi:hypothetical protein
MVSIFLLWYGEVLFTVDYRFVMVMSCVGPLLDRFVRGVRYLYESV